MRSFSLLALALVLSVAGTTARAQEATLRWKFAEGDKLYLETTSAFKQNMKTQGKDLKQDFELITLVSLLVQKVNADKTVALEERIESMAVKMQSGGGTASPDDKFAAQLQGAAFQVTFDPAKGEVTKFEGYDEIVKKIAGDDPAARKVVQATLTEDGLKRAAVDALTFVPDKTVKKGDTWKRSGDVSLGPLGSFKVERTYTYAGKESVDGKDVDKVTLAVKAEYVPPAAGAGKGDAGLFPFQVAKGELKIEDFQGVAYFDSTAGRALRIDTSRRLKGPLSISVGGVVIDTEVSQEQSDKTRFLDKPPAPAAK